MDHPLNANPVDDDGLWDELSHQQSREIQQHHQSRSMSTATRQSLHAVLSRTSEGLSYAADALKQVCYRPVQRHDNNLDDFGISSENDDPLLAPQEEPQQQQQHDFVLLRSFKILPRRDGWGAVANLDLFFTSLYNYYYHRGLVPLLGKGVVELFSLVLTLWLSVFLFAYVDWHALATCTDEATCHQHFEAYLIDKPFRRLSLWNLLVILYCMLFLCYTAFFAWTFLEQIRDALEAKHFFEERLGISEMKLEGGAVDWDRDVVEKIVALQMSGEHRVAIHGQDLDALVVAQRILRKENFMVAFFNRRMLDLTVPGLKGTYFCKSLEWSLYFCVLNYMFNHKYQIRPAFYLDAFSLKRRFILCGIAHAVFMPFLLFFMTLHFSMQNVYVMKSSKEYLGPRDWTLPAKWTFREFNELPHFYERRMGPSYDSTEKYLKLFTQSTIVTTLGRLLVMIGGSLGAILVAFAALNDAILLHVKIGDWNLLWYFGVLGVVYSSGKSLQPSPAVHPRYMRNLFGEMEEALAQVATHTHHYPEVWKARGWDRETYKAVSALFQYKAKLFVLEVVSVILAPIILCVSLPKCAEHICEFVMTIKSEVLGAGDVCGYATFDFDNFGDDNWEGRTMGGGGGGDDFGALSNMSGSVSASVIRLNNVEAATKMHPKPKAMQGKMEKSFFSFKANHPNWRSTESGQTLIDRIETYQNEETKALARERQHHMEAAARQLETLTQLEKRRQTGLQGNSISQMDTSYMRAAAGADSGGGFVHHAAPMSHEAASFQQPQMPGSTSRLRRDPLDMPTDDSEVTSLPSAQAVHAPGHSPPQHVKPAGTRLSPTNPASLSVPHYADAGLSTELTNMLGRSSFDPGLGLSAMGSSVVGGGVYDPFLMAARHPVGPSSHDELDGRDRTERQYQLLERYHAHLAGQRQQPMAQSFVDSSSNRTRTREALPTMPEEGRFDGRHSLT